MNLKTKPIFKFKETYKQRVRNGKGYSSLLEFQIEDYKEMRITHTYQIKYYVSLQFLLVFILTCLFLVVSIVTNKLVNNLFILVLLIIIMTLQLYLLFINKNPIKEADNRMRSLLKQEKRVLEEFD